MSGKNKNSESPTIERVFELLDKWRHLPTYQLERRADIFFALFLPDILKNHFKHLEINPMIVPEFPIRKPPELQSKKPDGYESNRVDYFAYSSKGAHSFIIELKTDMSSKDKDQMKRLEKTAKTDIESLISDVIDISKSKSADRQKYVHLLWHLQELGLVSGVDEDVYNSRAFPKVKSYIVKNGLENVKVTNAAKRCSKPKPIYVLPKLPKSCIYENVHCISFETFAGIVENGESKDSAIGKSFVKYLRKWKVRAGTLDPRTLH